MHHNAPLSAADWTPPANWMRMTTIDMHTGGEPLRVVLDGLPIIPGATVLDKRRHFREHLDALRMRLMWEPRGHADMYGAVLSRAADGAHFDVFFLHNDGYSTMCGHAIIALTKLVVEMGWVATPANPVAVRFNVPAGRIEAGAELEDGQVRSSWFRNVPSFVLARDVPLSLPDLGEFPCDIAYGGAFYALVDASRLGLELTAANTARLIDLGRRIKVAAAAAHFVHHPFEPELSFLYGTIFTGPAEVAEHHSRNVCIFADGEVDRSATGSGVSARAALLHARGELATGQAIDIESIVDSCLRVRIVDNVTFGPHAAVIPEVSGSAYYCGRSEFVFDPADPLVDGFLVR